MIARLIHVLRSPRGDVEANFFRALFAMHRKVMDQQIERGGIGLCSGRGTSNLAKMALLSDDPP